MKIIKRSGSEAVYDSNKIIAAVQKANASVIDYEKLSDEQIREIADNVETACENMKRSPSVEEIQDMVENQLMNKRAFTVARNYITYRYKRALVRKSNSTDQQILSLLECNNEEVKQENSNKNPTVNSVQRVPETESQGRIQTSTCSVAVMPEAEDVDVKIDDKDIRIDVMRASGNGGQCVNTTDSAVRLTHYPTGIVIYSQTEKSQIQNKEKAFALLRTKLYDLELQKKQDAEAEERRSQIGTGDRAEKIRTYNFPQGRVTDHRINLTLYKLDKILNGDIQEIIDACIAADQAKKLSRMETEA